MPNAPASYATRRYNPMTGCEKGLPCWDRCWARGFATRHRGRFGYPKSDPFRPTFHPDRLDEPLRWKGRQVAAVSFMGDIGAPGVKDEWLCALWAVMSLTPQHRYLILTKRPARLASWLMDPNTYDGVLRVAEAIRWGNEKLQLTMFGISNPATAPLRNVWIGTSFSNQEEYDLRRPELDGVPAAHRWLSYEPATGPVDFGVLHCCKDDPMPINWTTMGCESGPKRRPFDQAWARATRDQCAAAGIPWYYKQGTKGYCTDPDKSCPVDCERQTCSLPVVKKPLLDGVRHASVPWEAKP